MKFRIQLSCSLTATIIYSVWFAVLVVRTSAQLQTVPPCQVSLTDQCTTGAIEAAQATDCNWYLVIPALSNCIDNALMGCQYAEVLVYQQLVSDYNFTLQLDTCNPACTNQSLRQTEVFQCLTYSGGQIENVINNILNQNSANPAAQCSILSSMTSCLQNVTSGCPALTDYAYDRINAVNGSAAYSYCGLAPFKQTTTNAPVNLLVPTGALTMPPSSTVTTPAATFDPGQLALVIIGSIVILATIIVILILLVLTIRNRRLRNWHRDNKSLLADMWRPFGQKAYSRPPSDPPILVRPTSVQTQAFRPVNYTSNMGYYNEGMQSRVNI